MKPQSYIKHSFCPYCRSRHVIKRGSFYRKITKSYHQRHFCRDCQKSFSSRTNSLTYKQKRPDINLQLFELLNSGVTLWGSARILKVKYTSVYKKFLWLSEKAAEYHGKQKFLVKELQFDEMESIEHTKLKPLTIALAVSENYKILGAKVGTIPAKGHLAQIAYKKYGPRENESTIKIKELLTELKPKLLTKPDLIKSDKKPSYSALAKELFKDIPYEQYLSRGNKEKKREMKYQKQEKKIFDPLFALNQRCAKLRADIKRLTRRSWCTTKKKEHLERHLMLYIAKNNQYAFLA